MKDELDLKIKDFEEVDHDLTYREFIRVLETSFELQPAPLDDMTDEELEKYDDFLFELRLK